MRGAYRKKQVFLAKPENHFAVAFRIRDWFQALAWMAAILISGSPADATELPPGASSCSGCHAGSAAVQTPIPRLMGRPADELAGIMRLYRTGQRSGTVMDRIAKGFTEAEILAIAAWYAAQKE